MGTSADEVFDLFMAKQTDQRLITIYQTSGPSALSTYLEPWLLSAIIRFQDIADQDLTYSTTSQTFTNTLSLKNQEMLAEIMVEKWIQKTVNDIQQMNLHLKDRDFDHYSEAQNLKEKRDLLAMKREEISQMLTSYGYRVNDWSAWANQNFMGS
jgi:hypothetical protein